MTIGAKQKKIVGENIRAVRAIRGLTQRTLAEKMDIAFQNLCAWEKGKVLPSAYYLVKVSEILDVSIDLLCKENGISDIADQAIIKLSTSDTPPKPQNVEMLLSSEEYQEVTSKIAQIVSTEFSSHKTLRKIGNLCAEIHEIVVYGSPMLNSSNFIGKK